MHCVFFQTLNTFFLSSLLASSSSSSSVLFIFLSLGVKCEIEGIRAWLCLSLVLSFVERKTVKKRRGFVVVRSRVGLLRFLLSRERRLKKEKR